MSSCLCRRVAEVAEDELWVVCTFLCTGSIWCGGLQDGSQAPHVKRDLSVDKGVRIRFLLVGNATSVMRRSRA